MKRAIPGTLYILIAATLWGTTGTSQALAPQGVNPLTIGAARILIGGLALIAIALLGGGFRQRARWSIGLVAGAAITTAAYQVLFFGGTRLAGVAVGTLVGIGSAPIFAGILGAVFDRERLSRAWIIATALALVGCSLLVISTQSADDVNLWGVPLALGAGLSYALFTLFNKRLLADHRADEVMAVSFGVGALLLLPTLFFASTGWIFTTGGLVVVLHLGLIATGLAYVCFGRGLQTVSVATVGTLTLAEPLTAALLGVFVVGERLPVLGWVGVAVLFGGLAVLALRRN
ncbi:MAG: DMT family transporter [Phototrophicaceae bacterium]|jgi:DME family drug/metabolite transporter